MQKKRSFALLLALLVLLLSFGAVNAQDTKTTFKGAWPYQVPPTGHFNMFATNSLALGIYEQVMFPAMGFYHWADGTYEGLLADKFGYDADNNYVVTLKSGIQWADGTPVTSKDVVATFNTGYLVGRQAWKLLTKVEAVDDLTVKFDTSSPSKLLERLILTEPIRPASVYGQFGDAAAPLIAAGTTSGDSTFDALLKKLTDFRPDKPQASGPYIIDPSSITDASIMLVKNPHGLDADKVKFDQLQIWNGETEVVTPLVANGDVWYATHGFPPATEKSFIDQGIDIIRGPGYSGPAIYVNYKVAPLDKVEVRQAMAYVINRDQNGFVSLGDSGVAVADMSGMSDALDSAWLTKDQIAQLNTYDTDTDKATSLLEGIGFKKDADGHWMDDQGKPLAFTMEFPSDYADWSAAAENAIEQLNAFGFQITGSAVVSTQQLQDVYDSNFQMAIRNWGVGSPFPGESYLQPYSRFDGQGTLAGEQAGGMNFDTNVTYSGGQINVADIAVKSEEGLDVATQKQYVWQLAQSFNELLPIIPLWERHGNNPLNRKFLNAPAADDPIYINPWGSAADGFTPYLILTGGMSPASS